MGTLRDLYKDSLTYNNPLRFQVKAVITLPSEGDALTRNISKTSRGPSYIPTMQPLLPFL